MFSTENAVEINTLGLNRKTLRIFLLLLNI
jgi:hypothetical protein